MKGKSTKKETKKPKKAVKKMSPSFKALNQATGGRFY